VDAVLADAAVRVGVMRRGHQGLLEVAAREYRDALVEHMSQVVHPAFPDLLECGEPLGVVDQGEHPELVCGGGAHSEDQGSRKLGNSVSPPSTKIVCPVIYPPSSLARKHATAPISPAVPARAIGMWLSTISRLTGSSIHARLIGVTVAPGPIPLTRIPRPAYSSASVRVRFCIPPLLTE